MGVKPESLKRRMARQEIESPHPAPPRGRPEVIPEPVRERLRERYRESYKQWGPTVLAAWAEREGLGSYSPTTIARVIEDLKDPEEPKEPPRRYEITDPGVMWSEDGAGFRDNGRKQELLVLQDECSRFKVNTRLVHGPAKATDVCDYLREAFDQYGPPLVLKHDGDSIFHEESVERLLTEYRVVSLTSPPHYPPFNGKMERAIRDIKSYTRAMKRHDRGLSLEERLDATLQDLNDVRPRPVLGGRTSREVFERKQNHLPDRNTFFTDVQTREASLLDEAASRKQRRQARQTAVELVLLRYGMMKEINDVSTYSEAKTWTF
jgi:transposase InsO family protein